MPTHQAGDVIVAVAFRATNNTNPTKPTSGTNGLTWNTILNPTGTNSCSCVLVYGVATASNHTSGTFGATNDTLCVVLRGAAASPIGANVLETYNSVNPTAPSATLNNTDGTSALLHFFLAQGTFAPSNWNAAAPAGYTKQQAISRVCVDSKNDTTSDGSVSQSNSDGTGKGIGITLEIVAH
jgi:hypothetical protein